VVEDPPLGFLLKFSLTFRVILKFLNDYVFFTVKLNHPPPLSLTHPLGPSPPNFSKILFNFVVHIPHSPPHFYPVFFRDLCFQFSSTTCKLYYEFIIKFVKWVLRWNKCVKKGRTFLNPTKYLYEGRLLRYSIITRYGAWLLSALRGGIIL